MHPIVNSIEKSVGTPFNPFDKVSAFFQYNQWRFLTLFLIINDMWMVGMAFLLAYFVRFYSDLPLFEIGISPVYDYYRNLTRLLHLKNRYAKQQKQPTFV
ncbi:MAG: hypothetical protein BroJett015_33070 [Chloroflexota bacterium]|nr:MAG: hypothetical protein BroJett015_33070 [Chloroflexota bacterium]